MSSDGMKTKRSATEGEGGTAKRVKVEAAMKAETDDEEEIKDVIKQDTDDEGEHIKKEGGNSEPIKLETDDEGDDKDDSSIKLVDVEFKFRSCQTYLVKDGQWEGTLHVKMLQDQKTGRHRLPEGRHPVQWKMTRDNVYDDTRSIYGLNPKRGDDEEIEQSFQGNLTKQSSSITFSFGMDLTVESEEDVYEFIEPSGEEKELGEWGQSGYVQKVVPFTNKRTGQLKNWVLHQGGMLAFHAHADCSDIFIDEDEDMPMTLDVVYKLKLYTVLSVHIPNTEPLQAEKGHVVDWAFLENVVAARFPKKGAVWAKKAVAQYRLFLELKIANEDWKSTKFSPSGPIDEIWHAHISFPDRYQHDIFSLTENKHLIEHTPVLKADSMKRYGDAYAKHVKRMAEKKEAVDENFWPDPNVVVVGDSSDESEVEDDSSVDSDAHLDIGYAPSCG